MHLMNLFKYPPPVLHRRHYFVCVSPGLPVVMLLMPSLRTRLFTTFIIAVILALLLYYTYLRTVVFLHQSEATGVSYRVNMVSRAHTRCKTAVYT